MKSFSFMLVVKSQYEMVIVSVHNSKKVYKISGKQINFHCDIFSLHCIILYQDMDLHKVFIYINRNKILLASFEVNTIPLEVSSSRKIELLMNNIVIKIFLLIKEVAKHEQCSGCIVSMRKMQFSLQLFRTLFGIVNFKKMQRSVMLSSFMTVNIYTVRS